MNDLIAILLYFTIIIVYHSLLVYTINHNPELTMIGFMRKMRRFWVLSLLKRSQPELAIHCFRNTLYATNASSSTAIILVLAVSASSRISSKPDNPASVLLGNDNDADILWVKLLFIALCLLLCFFFLSQAMRFFDHMGFLMSVTTADLDSLREDGYVFPADENIGTQMIELLQRAGFFYTMGVRCYYLIFPLVLWFFGPYYFMGASVINICVFLFLDSNPGYFQAKGVSSEDSILPERSLFAFFVESELKS